jgi:hypothetical protein
MWIFPFPTQNLEVNFSFTTGYVPISIHHQVLRLKHLEGEPYRAIKYLKMAEN